MMTTGTEHLGAALLPASAALMPPPGLRFAADAAELRTDFRDYVLNLAYAAACRELGDALQAAEVSVYRSHWEPAPPVLTLSILAAIGVSEFGKVHKAMAQAVGAAAASWSDSDRADYAQSVHYELVPLPV